MYGNHNDATLVQFLQVCRLLQNVTSLWSLYKYTKHAYQIFLRSKYETAKFLIYMEVLYLCYYIFYNVVRNNMYSNYVYIIIFELVCN